MANNYEIQLDKLLTSYDDGGSIHELHEGVKRLYLAVSPKNEIGAEYDAFMAHLETLDEYCRRIKAGRIENG